MNRLLVASLGLLLLAATAGYAAEAKKVTPDEEAKALSGMSIVGNDEAPKALYIVPWKSSELGVETGLNMLNNNENTPVDREEFARKLEYYKVSTSNQFGR